MADDSYVTREEAEAALGRLRLANHLSVRRYRDVVYALQWLMRNPGEVPTEADVAAEKAKDRRIAELEAAAVETAAAAAKVEPATLSAESVRSIVAETIAAAVKEIPRCGECEQELPAPEPAPSAPESVVAEYDVPQGNVAEEVPEEAVETTVKTEKEPISLVDLEDSYTGSATAAEYAAETPTAFEY